MALAARNIKAEESMEAQIARLEATVEHIQSDVKDLRQDVKDIRQDMKGLDGEMKGLNEKLNTFQKEVLEAFASLKVGRDWDRVWMLLSMGTLLGVMARGFKWI